MRKLKYNHHLYLLADQVGDGSSELGVQGGVHLVEEIEWCGVTFLDGEDEGEGHYGLLATRELVHVLHDPAAWGTEDENNINNEYQAEKTLP